MIMANEERFIQVGVTALRDPGTGDFLPSVPLYIREDDCTEGAQEQFIQNIGKLFALRFKDYVDKCREAGVEI